jgi:ribosomal protein L29
VERFKDKFSKSADTIRSNKKEVARALTELNARRNKPETK